MKIRVEEAIARARQQGLQIRKKDIAARLWPYAGEQARATYMSRLCSGLTERVTADMVRVIADMTGCTADFLFGISDEF